MGSTALPESSITIFDGNNYLRRKYEEDHSGSTLRAIVLDIRTELARKGNRCVFVLDGVKCNKYRRDIFPGYKVGRPDTPDAFNEQKRIFNEIVKHLPIITIEVPEYEADDIIAALVETFRASPHFPDAKYHIKTTDKDFHQLDVSYEGKGLGIPAEETVLFKTLVGDASDKIPGMPGFGLKKYEALNKPEALQWLEDGFPVDRIPVDIPKTQADWAAHNQATLVAYRDICRFRPVPEGLIESHSHFGMNKPEEVERILKENLA